MSFNTKQFLWIFLTGLMLVSCSDKKDFKISGTISGANDQTLYLEQMAMNGVVLLDSAKLNDSGKFKFKQPRTEYPEFYRLRLKNNLINLAIDSTEHVSLTADAGTFATSYSVEGSENCKVIKEITLAQLDANQAMNKINKNYRDGQISQEEFQEGVLALSKRYKDVARKYIYAAPSSTAAYYALFQTIDGLLFFDLYNPEDSRAFGAVATSFDYFYPNNPRTEQLKNLALMSMKVIRDARRTPVDLDSLGVKITNYPDIKLKDHLGTLRTLSEEAEGKVMLVCFTAYAAEWSPELNISLKKIYDTYHNKGLEIFQVSLDVELNFWRNAASNLPWICVLDPNGPYSEYAGLYNVRQLPALFLLDKKGTLIGRIESTEHLIEMIKKAL